MKKLLIFLSALVIVAFIAAPVFAMEMYEPEQRAAKLAEEKASVLKASGELTFGAITPFDSADEAVGYANMYVDFTLWPDEYNSILFELAGSKVFAQGPTVVTEDYGVPIGEVTYVEDSNGLFTVPYFELTTDVGKALDLPMGLKNTAGLTSLYTSKYEVTGLAYERTQVRSWIDPLAWKFAADFGGFKATAALGFGFGDVDQNDVGIFVEIPEVGPAVVEAWYLSENNAEMKGKTGFDVKAADLMDGMLGVAAGLVYDVAEDAGGWGVGASIMYDPFTIGASVNGYDQDPLWQLGVDANWALNDTFGLDAALGYSFADDDETTDLAEDGFQGIEFSVYAKVGAAKWAVGYTYADNTGFAYAPAVSAPDGGIFVNADVDF